MCDGYNYNNMHKNETKSHSWLMVQLAVGCNNGVLVNKTQKSHGYSYELIIFPHSKNETTTLKITSQSKTGP